MSVSPWCLVENKWLVGKREQENLRRDRCMTNANKVGRCKLTVTKSNLKAPLVSTLETSMC